MVEANAKTLRPLVKAAMRAAAEARGWRSAPKLQFTAGPDLVEPPLRVVLDPEMVGDAYGGLRIGMSAIITIPSAEQEVSTYGLDALPTHPYLALGDWAVDFAHIGQWTERNGSTRHWLITDTDDVGPTVEDWAAALDGPMSDWLAARSTEDRLLDLVTSTPDALGHQQLAGRLLALRALRTGRTELSRHLISQSEPGYDDSPERIAAFERRLAEHHPEYGPLQRT